MSERITAEDAQAALDRFGNTVDYNLIADYMEQLERENAQLWARVERLELKKDYTPTDKAEFCNQAGPMGDGCDDARVDLALVPIGDGLTIIRKKS